MYESLCILEKMAISHRFTFASILPLCSIMIVIFAMYIFSQIFGNNTKICTARKFLHSRHPIGAAPCRVVGPSTKVIPIATPNGAPVPGFNYL